MYYLEFIPTLLLVGLSAAVIAQAFEIKRLRKKIEIENDEGSKVYIEFTDGDVQAVKGVGMVSSEDTGITLRASNGDIVAAIKPELVRAVYAEWSITAEEDSE